MPNSATKAATSGLTFPGTAGSSASADEERPLYAYIERTMEGIEDFARREPWALATWVFGVGFVLSWKLKPW